MNLYEYMGYVGQNHIFQRQHFRKIVIYFVTLNLNIEKYVFILLLQGQLVIIQNE